MNTAEILVTILFVLILLATDLFIVWFHRNFRDSEKQKFILINNHGRLVRAKVLKEHDTWYAVVTMDDHDDGAVDLRVNKTDSRIARVYYSQEVTRQS